MSTTNTQKSEKNFNRSHFRLRGRVRIMPLEWFWSEGHANENGRNIMKLELLGLLLLTGSVFVHAGGSESKTSPNGKIIVDECFNGMNRLDVSCCTANGQKQHVMTISDLGLRTADNKDGKLFLVGTSKCRRISVRYSMVSGKKALCQNRANEYVYTFSDNSGRRQNMVLRLYDDGIALRYVWPDSMHTVVTGEQTTFAVENGSRRWMEQLDGYEGYYRFSANSGSDKQQWGFPALFSMSDAVWMLLTEANLCHGNCASHLRGMAHADSYGIELADEQLNIGSGWTSPWRVAIIGGLDDVVQSTLVTDVSDACKLADTSWIKPGTVSWVYWAYNHGSKDFQIVKQYVDMAVALKLPYVLIDWEWDRMSNGGTMEDAVRYALQQGVKPLLWYNSSTAKWSLNAGYTPLFRLNTHESRMKEFARLDSLGVVGVKIDFFDGEGQNTINYYLDILEDAAKYRLLVDFHGATIPRGWQRTYPNLMSTEAVRGAEWYNNVSEFTYNAAWHNATLPFTRNVVGSMDYTPCAFSDSQHKHITTNAHELALTVIFESGLQHLADKPSSFLAQDAKIKDFFSLLPAAWDETRLLKGYPSQYVVMARRRGSRWFVAGINGTDKPMTLKLDLSFMKKKHALTLFSDGADSRTINVGSFSTTDGLGQIETLPRGGFVIVGE
jgi:hypothetical protein